MAWAMSRMFPLWDVISPSDKNLNITLQFGIDSCSSRMSVSGSHVSNFTQRILAVLTSCVVTASEAAHLCENASRLECRIPSFTNNFLPAWRVPTSSGFVDVSHTVNASQRKTLKTAIPESKAVMPSLRNPTSKGFHLGFCGMVCHCRFASCNSTKCETKVRLPKMNKVPPCVNQLGESSKISGKMRVFKQSQSTIFSSVTNVRNATGQASATGLVQFVTARATLFRDHGMSGLPMGAQHEHFKKFDSKLFSILPQFPGSSILN